MSSAGPARRVILLGLVIAALPGSLAWAPSAAHAIGCEDSWTNVAGGSWFEGGNWSANSPPKAGEAACITAAGTYTVTMNQTSEGVTVKALTIGGASGAQTLSVASTCSSAAKLTSTSGFAVEANGALTMTKSGACNNDVRIAGSLTNDGIITSESGENTGHRFIEGNLANKGTLTIGTDTEYDGASATLVNEGTINLVSGSELLASNNDTVTNAAGTIASSGTGNLFVQGGTFNQGAGKSSGEPIFVDDGAVNLTGTGAASIATRGTSTLGGEELAKGQKLTIESTCGEHANLTRAGALLNNGTIVLTNADVCGNQANLLLGESTLLNKGTIDPESPSGGARIIEGNLRNERTLSIAAGASVKVEGVFTQTKTGTYVYGIASSSRSGSLSVQRPANIGGTLSLNVAKGFIGALGQGYLVLSAPGYTGTFAKVKSATITSKVEPGLYYSPEYLLEDVDLRVKEAKVTVTPVEGAPGATVKLSGTDYPASDVVKLSFADAKGVKTTFTSAATAFNGDLATEVTIPPSAAEGTGTFTAQDTVTGVKATVKFKVT